MEAFGLTNPGNQSRCGGVEGVRLASRACWREIVRFSEYNTKGYYHEELGMRALYRYGRGHHSRRDNSFLGGSSLVEYRSRPNNGADGRKQCALSRAPF